MYTMRSDHKRDLQPPEPSRAWTADPNHPRWDTPVGYSHAANILELLSQNA